MVLLMETVTLSVKVLISCWLVVLYFLSGSVFLSLGHYMSKSPALLSGVPQACVVSPLSLSKGFPGVLILANCKGFTFKPRNVIINLAIQHIYNHPISLA